MKKKRIRDILKIMRIAIVENEQKERDHYCELLKEYEKENAGTKNEVFLFDNGFDFIEKYPSELDCIFMDIDMPQINGMETSKKIREIDPDVIIIFVTNLPQFAIDGYKVQALDFLLKPFKYIDLKVELEKIKRFRSVNAKTKSLWISQKGTTRRINLDDIVYIEIMHHDVIIHSLKEEVKFRGSLTAIEEKLDNLTFERISNSFIVNLKFVEGVVKGECKLAGNIYLPISRNNKAHFLDKLNSFMNYDLD